MIARAIPCLIVASLCWPAPLAAQSAGNAPMEGANAPVIRVIPLKYADCSDVHGVIASLMRDVRVAVDPRTNSILVGGPKAAIDEVERFVTELDHPKEESSKPEPAPVEKQRFRVTLYFVAGDFEPKDRDKMGAPIPNAVKPAAKVLEDAGLTNLSLITTMMASVQETAQFEVEGSWPTDSSVYRVYTKGSLFGSPNSSAVSLDLNSELFRTEIRKPGNNNPSNEGVFKFSSTILANPGEYVVVGSSPAASGVGDSIALIVMFQNLPNEAM